MNDDGEPRENIGAGFGQPTDTPAIADAASRAEAVVDRLGDRYWRKTYGGRDAFTCLVRTILSQNTSDVASQPAFDALIDRFGSTDLATGIRDAPTPEIASTIQPAGLHNQKARVLQATATRVIEEFGDPTSFDRFVRDEPYEVVRETLLSISGVGPKTADCVLLFAGGRSGVFPVDTHIHRIFRRLGIAPPNADHETVRALLEGRTDRSPGVPPDKCGFGHTASIQFGREYCTARAPACIKETVECPLSDLCDQVGIDPTAGTVRDPAESLDR